MKYDDFVAAVAYYEKSANYDEHYWPYLERVQREWDNPSIGLAGAIVDFLNKWKMRTRKTDSLLEEIFTTLIETRPYVAALQSLTFEDTDLQGVLQIGPERLRIQTACLLVFERFYSIGNRFVDVATAKTLHLLAPKFFVIWDTSTQFNLSVSKGSFAWRYAYSFLPRVHADLQTLIAETQARFNLPRDAAIERLSTIGKKRKTLVKLADEYYYSKFTKGFVRKKTD